MPFSGDESRSLYTGLVLPVLLTLVACGGGGGGGGGGSTPDNTVPVAHPQSLRGCGSIVFTLTGEDTETPAHELTPSIVTPPAQGAVSQPLPGTWVYVPDDEAVTSDSLEFTVFDGDLTSEPATVSLTLEPLALDSAASRFVKLDSEGCPLADQSQDYSWGEGEASGREWRCVADADSGLFWEVKSPPGAGTLQDTDSSFTWLNRDTETNGGDMGNAGSSGCNLDGGCNTEDYAAAINSQFMCHRLGWRVPTVTELQGIVDFSLVAPAMDEGYFPNTLDTTVNGAESRYWSAISLMPENQFGQSGFAWYVHAYYGTVQADGGLNDDHKAAALRVRLVTEGQ